MRDDVVNLVSSTYTLDDYGVQRPSETSKQVFCRIKSITQTEYYQSLQAGMRDVRCMVIFSGDYGGEQEAEYYGIRYTIYRTYQTSDDELELYLTPKAGA